MHGEDTRVERQMVLERRGSQYLLRRRTGEGTPVRTHRRAMTNESTIVSLMISPRVSIGGERERERPNWTSGVGARSFFNTLQVQGSQVIKIEHGSAENTLQSEKSVHSVVCWCMENDMNKIPVKKREEARQCPNMTIRSRRYFSWV